MQMLERSPDVLNGVGELIGDAGDYGRARYRLMVHDADQEGPSFDAPANVHSDIYLDGSIKIEHGMNLMQTLSMTLVLEDGRTIDVVHATGEPLTADWEITGTPVHPEQFRAG